MISNIHLILLFVLSTYFCAINAGNTANGGCYTFCNSDSECNLDPRCAKCRFQWFFYTCDVGLRTKEEIIARKDEASKFYSKEMQVQMVKLRRLWNNDIDRFLETSDERSDEQKIVLI